MGISDHHHFERLTGALGRFEAQQRKLAVLAHESGPHAISCMAGQQEIPPIAFLRDSLVSARPEVLFRDARYFYRHVGKFNPFLLTVLSPVGK